MIDLLLFQHSKSAFFQVKKGSVFPITYYLENTFVFWRLGWIASVEFDNWNASIVCFTRLLNTGRFSACCSITVAREAPILFRFFIEREPDLPYFQKLYLCMFSEGRKTDIYHPSIGIASIFSVFQQCKPHFSIIDSNDSICFSPTPRSLIIMKLFFFLWGFFTFSTAIPSEIRHGQEVPPLENSWNGTQLHLAQPKDVAAVQGINQNMEIRQPPFVVPTAMAFGVPAVGLVAALVVIATLTITEVEDDAVRNTWIL